MLLKHRLHFFASKQVVSFATEQSVTYLRNTQLDECFCYLCVTMEKNTKHTAANNRTSKVKKYEKSPFVAKKIQLAKETLQEFPVPHKYVK